MRERREYQMSTNENTREVTRAHDVKMDLHGMCSSCSKKTEWEQADRALTCTFECRTVPLSFVSYEGHGKAASDGGE